MRLHTHDQLLEALDEIVARSSRGDRTSPAAQGFWADLLTRADHPLATDLPDENLLDWHGRGLLGDLDGRRVLDIGCGRGRNARWFAEQGAVVDGIDIAADLLTAARPAMPRSASLTVCDVLRDPLPCATYDLVYDSGCFHHLAPHRRETYVQRVLSTLPAGGTFGIVAFCADEIRSPPDVEILASGDLGGGIGYTLDELAQIFAALTPVEARRVRADSDGGFGADFLGCAIFRRPGDSA